MNKIKDFLHHFFIPHEHNNYRAKAVHIDFLSYYLVFALFITFAFKGISSNFPNVLGFATDISVEKLFELTNKEREKNNLPQLSYNSLLSKAAEKKAEDMFQKNYWAHYSPDGKTPWDFILSEGYQYEYAGENLAKNFLFSQGVVDAWMNSKTHRENIVRKEYSEVGYAIVNGVLNGEQTTLVVQMFGKPSLVGIAKEPVPERQQTPELVQTNQNENLSKVIPNSQLGAEVLSKVSNSKPKINLFHISFNINLIFIVFLFAVLLMDIYFATKTNVVRITGKTIAHLIFIGFIFLGLFILTKGSIL